MFGGPSNLTAHSSHASKDALATTSLLRRSLTKVWFGVLFLLYLCGFRVMEGEHFCENFFG